MSLFLSLAFVVLFPAFGMSVQTEPISVDAGQLGSPTNPDQIGVYELPGNLLMVAHVDWGGQLRPGFSFRNLELGDQIVVDSQSYHVTDLKEWAVNDQDAWDWTVASDGDEITLITCTGQFSVSRHEYLERLSVRAVRDTLDVSQ